MDKVFSVAEVPVNPKVLEWARRLRGFSEAEAAALLEISETELREYETGRTAPLVGLLRRMSARYRINFASLLMPEPLPAEERLTDHRQRPGTRRLSVDTLVAIEEVQEALDAFDDLREAEADLVPALRIGSAKLTDEPEEVAARERRRFGVSLDDQRDWRGVGDARRAWRLRIEDRGIFTYMIPMPPDEISGFSIMRPQVAAICVNDRESTEGAKIFTFFHEYCHLLLRQTGISDENNRNRVERFCNQFAGAFLIPRAGLIAAVGGDDSSRDFSDAQIRTLAARFRVSNRAMAMRLEETKLAPKGFYARRTKPWDVPVDRPPIAPDSKLSYVTLRKKRLGTLHTRTVLRAVRHRVINSFDASELLGLAPTTISKLQAPDK
jgi:Zn-dependent peptidase ImmA (M78 family)